MRVGARASVMWAALVVAALGAPAATLEVRPGAVVRWSGGDTTSCAMGERRWPALGDTCWYPVDLGAGGVLVVTRTRAGHEERAQLEVGPYPYPEQRLEVADAKVHLAADDEARAARETREVAALWERAEGPVRFSLPLAPPLRPLPAGGRFGARRIFNGEPRSPHSGADYRAPAGTPVYAAADGTVALTGEHFFSGRSVFIDHGGGLVTMYFHLRRIVVAEGEPVRRGEKLGEVGASGRATGPHLHFGVRWHGARVDPALLLGEPDRVPSLGR